LAKILISKFVKKMNIMKSIVYVGLISELIFGRNKEIAQGGSKILPKI